MGTRDRDRGAVSLIGKGVLVRMLRSWFVRLLNFFKRDHWEQELTDEMQSNLEFQIEDNVRSGMTPQEARRAAHLRFGSIDAVKEGVRDRLGIPVLEHFIYDLGYAIRTLAKRPILLATTTISVSIRMRLPTTSNTPEFFSLRAALATTPGVEAVSSGDLPVGLIGFDRVHKIGVPDDAGFSVQVNSVGPQYLKVMGIHILRGRDLRDEDVSRISNTTPIVVGETFARRYLGSIDVIDQQLLLGRDRENGREARRLQIVGVAQDGTVQIFGGERIPVLYSPSISSSFVVRVAGSPAGTLRRLEQTIVTLEPGAAVNVAPMATRLAGMMLPVRVATVFLSAIGATALLLAMTGLYGIVSYAANRRRFEMGLRIALGASWLRIMRLMLRDPILIVGTGSIAGGVLSLVLIRAIWPLIAGGQISTTPLALLAVLVLMMTVAIVATLRPAITAATADPVVALRQD